MKLCCPLYIGSSHVAAKRKDWTKLLNIEKTSWKSLPNNQMKCLKVTLPTQKVTAVILVTHRWGLVSPPTRMAKEIR